MITDLASFMPQVCMSPMALLVDDDDDDDDDDDGDDDDDDDVQDE